MRRISSIAAATIVLTASALAQAPHATIGDNNEVKWMPAPPSLPRGAQIAVLSGDPEKAGPFTIRLKSPANTSVPAHNHPADEYLTVISGEFQIGMGDKLDKSKVLKLSQGGFIVAPAKMNHFAFMPVETVVQVHGMGPFTIQYVDPADDPSKR